MKTSRIFLTVVITILLLTACAPATPVSTPTPYPTQVPYDTQTPYPTFTEVPSATPTATPVPSATSAPKLDPLLDQDGISSVIKANGWKLDTSWNCGNDKCNVYNNPTFQLLITLYPDKNLVNIEVFSTAAVDAQNAKLFGIVEQLFGTDVANWVSDNLKIAKSMATGSINAPSNVDGHPLGIDINKDGNGNPKYDVWIYPIK